MNSTMRPNDILAATDWFQVFWSNAVACVTKVVEGHSFRDWADQAGVRPPMGANRPTIKPKEV